MSKEDPTNPTSEMAPPVTAPTPKTKPTPAPTPAPAVVEFDEETRVKADAIVASWGAPVRRVFTRKARIATLRQYKKNPNMTKDELTTALKSDPELVGLDIATILALLTLAYKLYEFWKSRKASAADIPEDPEDPRAVEDPIMESENDGIEMV